MAQPTDEELFENFREGNVDSFERLYRHYRERLYTYVLSILGCRHDADEVFQKTFTTMVRRRSNSILAE